MKHHGASRVDEVYMKFEAEGCLDALEKLQYHKNMCVYSKATELVCYLNEETESILSQK